MAQHTKRINRAAADTSRMRKQIARDQKETQVLIKTPAFKKHRVITPGSRLGVLQARLRKNRKALKGK